ncbi:MAG: serine/threonine-protein kinase [Gemmatimonadaceae bacterium]
MSDLVERLNAHVQDWCTIERELGGGGMSRVFVAFDRQLSRRVVFKVLPGTLTATLSVERFRREIMLAAGLQHPHIVPVLTSGEVDGLPYFVMPFIEGESLRARLVRGPLSVRETLAICKDVLSALAFAHGRGVVHRDIKPDNVMLSSGAAVVTDFGVAKAIDQARNGRPVRDRDGARTPRPPGGATLTGVGISLGTPAYMAPEQVAADPNVDHRADIYALGILAYEMLVGTPPFYGSTPHQLLAAQLSLPAPPIRSRRSDVPPPLAVIIMRCLEKEPAQRPKSATELLRMLDSPDVASGDFIAPARRPWTKRRIMVWSTGILLAAAATAATFWKPGRADQAAVTPLLTPALGMSIEVAPFVAVGRDTTTEAAAVGLTSQVTNALAQIAGLRVTTRPGGAVAPGDSGSRNRFGMLLQATVQRERDRVRVLPRLVGLATDSTLWVGSFEGSSKAMFALQDSVAQAIVRAVASRVRP